MSDHYPTLYEPPTDRRYAIEKEGKPGRVAGNEWHTQRAASVEVEACGALVFRNVHGVTTFVAAPGTWLAVSSEDA